MKQRPTYVLLIYELQLSSWTCSWLLHLVCRKLYVLSNGQFCPLYVAKNYELINRGFKLNKIPSWLFRLRWYFFQTIFVKVKEKIQILTGKTKVWNLGLIYYEIYYARLEVTYLQVISNEIDTILPQLNQKERRQIVYLIVH